MTDELTELKQRLARLELLYQVSKVIHSSLDPQEALQLILKETVEAVRANSGSVVLLNPTNGFLEIEAAQGLPPEAAQLKLRVGEGITGWVARTGKPARVGNVQADPRYIAVKPNVKSELAVPLLVEEETRGVLNVDSEQPDAFTAEDQELLEEIAVQASKVIQNTWLYEQLRQKARMFEALASVSQTINSALNLEEALNAITREAVTLMGVKMCSLLLLDGTGEWLDLKASFGAGTAYINKPRLPMSESLLGAVVRRQKPVQVLNVQTSGRYQQVEIARKEGLVSLLSVPLRFKGEAIGTLNVYTDLPHNFSNEEIHVLTALAELSAISIERARLHERIVDVEDQLRQNEKLSALGLLAAEVAHEIRNPLTVIKMLYHSLDLKFPWGDPRSKDVQIMGEKMEALNKIVEQILDFARSVEPKFGPVNLNEVLNDLLLLTRHKLRNQQVECVLKLAPELPRVQADATQLEQAFLNLLLNAVEAMPNGGHLVITTKAESGRTRRLAEPPGVNDAAQPEVSPHPAGGWGGTVLVEFKDTGQGMSPEQCQRAFKSLLSTTKAGGTGLGLAIVNRVVEAHRGKISLKSQPGKGTAIRITLPM